MNEDVKTAIQDLQKILLFVQQVRLALKPNANPVIVQSCLEGCDFAKHDTKKTIGLLMTLDTFDLDAEHLKRLKG